MTAYLILFLAKFLVFADLNNNIITTPQRIANQKLALAGPNKQKVVQRTIIKYKYNSSNITGKIKRILDPKPTKFS